MRPIDADPIIKNLSVMKTQLGYDAIDIDGMIKALRETEEVVVAQLPNDPLTLDELREMDGEPVWWEDKYERAGYGIVSISEFDKVIYIVAANRTFVAAAHGEMNRHLGLTLYRRKLEEERRDKQRADRVVVWIF